EIAEDLARVGLVFVDRAVRPRILLGGSLGLQRDELMRRRDLRDHRLELRIEQRADVELAGVEERNHLRRDRVGIGEADLLHLAQIDPVDDHRAEIAAQYVEALLADAEDLDRLALGQKVPRMIARQTRDLAVETAAKATLRRADDEQVD